jgi:hypothetical protein
LRLESQRLAFVRKTLRVRQHDRSAPAQRLRALAAIVRGDARARV